MPKLFTLELSVEEVALGRVMRLLHNTPGVAKVHFDMGEPAKKHTNGTRKPKGTFSESGQDLVLRSLEKSSLPMSAIRKLFAAQGRSAHSASSIVHNLKTNDLIALRDGEYALTKKMRDRLRHRKGA